uniref:Uncharacterized protein n=1 Tax=Glossina austeni TaxID=7395 RepID=A0A1A9V4L8_GLOAU
MHPLAAFPITYERDYIPVTEDAMPVESTCNTSPCHISSGIIATYCFIIQLNLNAEFCSINGSPFSSIRISSAHGSMEINKSTAEFRQHIEGHYQTHLRELTQHQNILRKQQMEIPYKIQQERYHNFAVGSTELTLAFIATGDLLTHKAHKKKEVEAPLPSSRTCIFFLGIYSGIQLAYRIIDFFFQHIYFALELLSSSRGLQKLNTWCNALTMEE